jgi:glycosyltransferase involved in cell wall biosynthesis
MDKNKFPISVITIVKNNEDLLPRAIDSILSQTLSNFEYIIVNDGSTDGTRELIDSYVKSDYRVTAVHLPECLGRSMARNKGLDAAAGSYIYFLDADDYVPENALEVLFEVAESNQADVVYGGTRCFDSKTGDWLSKHYTDDIVKYERHNIQLDDCLPLVNNHQIVGRLYRRQMLKKNNIRFSTVRKNGEDVLFSFYTALFAENISLLPSEKVYFYSLGNYIDTANESKLNDARDNVLETIKYAKDHGSEQLQKFMWKKGVAFAADLSRAAKVYEGKDFELLSYMKSLKPIVAGVDETILKSLSLYHRDYYSAISSGQYLNAYMMWQRYLGGYGNNISGNRVTTVSGCLRKTMSNTLYRLRMSPVWPLLDPFGHVAKKVRNYLLEVNYKCAPGSGIKVSVIIPVYNVEEFLRQCLASVASQTLSDIEIICVNDCSSDNSQVILDEYAADNEDFVLLTHDKNSGLSAARNTGLEASTGQYVFFLDSDDMIARDDALEILYRAACTDDADEVIGGVLKWHEHTGEKYLDWHKNYLTKEVRGEQLSNLSQLRCNVVAWNKLIKKSLLDENSIRFNEGIRKHEDNPFSCMVHVLTKKISIIPVTTYLYRQARSGSIMNKIKKEDAYSRNSYCSEIFRFIESNERFYQFRDMYYPMYSRQLIQGAGILSQFSPLQSEKIELMEKWAESLAVMTDELPGLSGNLRKIIFLVRSGMYEEAWDKAVLLDKK